MQSGINIVPFWLKNNIFGSLTLVQVVSNGKIKIIVSFLNTVITYILDSTMIIIIKHTSYINLIMAEQI